MEGLVYEVKTKSYFYIDNGMRNGWLTSDIDRALTLKIAGGGYRKNIDSLIIPKELL